MNAAEIARKAAQIISERGLAKGKLIDEDGRVCNNGALLLAMGLPVEIIFEGNAVPWGYHIPWNVITDTEMAILKDQGVSVTRPWQYNDDAAVSAEDVILLLKQTAEALEGK